MDFRKVAVILRETQSAWSDHDAPRLGAALAFYTLLSLAPLVILVVAIVGLVFGHKEAASQLAAQVQSIVGKEGAAAIQLMLSSRKTFKRHLGDRYRRAYAPLWSRRRIR